MAEFIKVHGLRELQAAMRELPRRIDRRILNAALMAAARPMVADAKAGVPVDTGKLRASIIAAPAKRTSHTATVRMRVSGATQVVKERRGKKVPTWVRSKDFPFYALFIERGTSKMSAKPFLRPAFERNKRSAIEIIKTRIAARIEVEAAKLKK